MKSRFLPHIVFLLLSGGVALLMVSNQSLWIDETQTALYADKPNLREWAQAMIQIKKSETLMPAGMYVAWASGRLIGTGEWELRAVNLLWTALAGLAMGLIGSRLKLPLLLLVFLIHPFVWYCANEARPYALQICAGAWLLYGVVLLETSPKSLNRAAWLLALAAITGSGSSLLFAFALAAAAVTLGAIYNRSGRTPLPISDVVVPAAVGLVSLGVIGGYYLWAIRQGAAGARIWQVSPLNLGFALYELLGFSGLGPPRNDLRELARSGGLFQHFLQRDHLLGCTVLALVYLTAAYRLWLARGDKLVRLLVLFLVAYGSLLFPVCWVMHFPFWGRHVAPALPFAVLLIVKLLSPSAEKPLFAEKIGFALLAICLTSSSVTLRFARAYGKDDYRSACILAEKTLAAGKTVWWSADPVTTAYYGLRESSPRDPARRFFLCYALTWEMIERFPAPDLIIRSKPDIHDPNGVIQDYLAKGDYAQVHRYPAFTVWARVGAQVEKRWFHPE